jgi:endoglucanase
MAMAQMSNQPIQTHTRRTRRPGRLAMVGFSAMLAALLLATGCSGVATEPPQAVTNATDVRPMFGAFTYGGVWQGMEPVHQLENLLGRKLDVVHWFMSWDTPYDVALVESAMAGGRLPMITWQPYHQSVSDIAAGRYDDLMRSFARGVRATPGLVYVRPFPEMNGDWEPWNGQPAEFVKAWRRMVDIFRAEGADNVRWVWSPNITDQPRTTANAMEKYYPGSAYVDVLALDGYNWGTSKTWSQWRSFDDIFAEPYARIIALGPQPVWVAEVASTNQGGDKAAWVASMLTSTKFPRIRALVWFNENSDLDWRLDNSLAVIQSARASLTPSLQTTASR